MRQHLRPHDARGIGGTVPGPRGRDEHDALARTIGGRGPRILGGPSHVVEASTVGERTGPDEQPIIDVASNGANPSSPHSDITRTSIGDSLKNGAVSRCAAYQAQDTSVIPATNDDATT